MTIKKKGICMLTYEILIYLYNQNYFYIRIRVSGIRGLQGVVRKTVSDNLQMNIWDKEYMDKIIPSLLYNMQDEQ